MSNDGENPAYLGMNRVVGRRGYNPISPTSGRAADRENQTIRFRSIAEGQFGIKFLRKYSTGNSKVDSRTC